MTFGTSEQTRRLVEVSALIGILNWGSTTVESMEIKKKCLKKLKNFAFPEEIIIEEDELWTCPVCLHISLDDECPKCTEVYLDLEIEE